MVMEGHENSGVLLCPVCKKPVEEDEWFVIASEAAEVLVSGSRVDGLCQRPVHLACFASFDPVEKIDADER